MPAKAFPDLPEHGFTHTFTARKAITLTPPIGITALTNPCPHAPSVLPMNGCN
jgi:hypothetical protein